jgi:predicted metal-dependent HD superfamily phosphohydrolase
MNAIASVSCSDGMTRRLRTRYDEPHRGYHTWAHVLACLEARARILRAPLPEVDLALLFHDAVYDPRASDNEERSASLLLDEGRREWMDERLLVRAASLVAATRHDGAGLDCDEACVVVDADLSILGAAPVTFDAYERGIRQEYAFADGAAYAAGRRAVLASFLERTSIYETRVGRELWESNARRNLERALAALDRS